MKPNWFVAVPVPAWTWLPGVLNSLPPECRPFQPEDVHMTVAFLGAMDPERKGSVIEVMNNLATQPLEIRLGPLLGLPSPKRVSALSFSVGDGEEAAKNLIGNCRGPLIEAAAARPDNRPPLAHITIARPNRKAGHQGRQTALNWAREVTPPEQLNPLTELALYTWAEDRRVRQFQIVYSRPL